MNIISNPTLKLLRIIGSPFLSGYELPNKDEALELYNFATKNKIGLAYLESLKNQKILEEFGLKSKYEEERIRHDKQMSTAIRISRLFNSSGVDYAIFKSIMPFPATPNDIDMIHFGTDKEYNVAVEVLLRSNYMEVKGDVDTQQRMFHDTEYGGKLNPHPKNKDVYDIDIYQKISASQIIYLDKRKLERYIADVNISNEKIRVLKSEAELTTIIIHSIIPEMLCTLQAYYSTVYHLARMDLEKIYSFIDFAKDNHVTISVKAHCSLVAALHKEAHGFIPEKIEKILAELGEEKGEMEMLLKEDFNMPHRYSSPSVAKVLFEKVRDTEFRRSAVDQLIFMLNPRIAKWVISNIIWRRNRETY